jgi:AcrR family transcriptional regulator
MAKGLANVRVPEIAEAAGVSTRTFNNYFSSKEEAIAWPATRRGVQMARNLLERPVGEHLGAALLAAITDLYHGHQDDGLPTHWLRSFRTLVASEPTLRGEYLKTSDAAERELAGAIAQRLQLPQHALQPWVISAVVIGAERAAILHWMHQKRPRKPLVENVRSAVKSAVEGIG